MTNLNSERQELTSGFFLTFTLTILLVRTLQYTEYKIKMFVLSMKICKNYVLWKVGLKKRSLTDLTAQIAQDYFLHWIDLYYGVSDLNHEGKKLKH